MDDGLDFNRLNQIYRDEKVKQELVKLDRDFYEQLSGYISRLSAAREDAERKSGPESPGAVMLRDEYKRATIRAKNVLELRLKKVMEMARIEMLGGKTDAECILPRETELKAKLIPVLGGWYRASLSEETGQTAPSVRDRAGSDASVKAHTAAMKIEPVPEPTDRMVVAVLADIPPFAGIERNYSLKKGDIVTVPSNIGNVLCKSMKARRIL